MEFDSFVLKLKDWKYEQGFGFKLYIPIVGVASMGGLGVVLILFPLLGVVAIRQYLLQRKLLYLKGKRSRILNEIVGGIKVCIITIEMILR